MAQRRMFSKKITETDIFLDMPMSTQCLYFHLNMAADDDGFVGNTKTVQRMIGASADDLKILEIKEFIIPFQNGIVVIRDWKIHNYIRSDRYTETVYLAEKSMVTTKENGQYELDAQNGIPNVIPNDNQMDTQVRLGKDRIGKYNSTAEIEQAEAVWKIYINKKGKADAIKKIPKLIKEYGYDAVVKAVEQYNVEAKLNIKAHNGSNQYVLNGSTFFNGRILDFLENTTEIPQLEQREVKIRIRDEA